MYFPGQLWTPGPKAFAGSILELVTHRTQQVVAAAIPIQQNGPSVPTDYVEVIHLVGVEWFATGAQFMDRITIHDADPVATLHAIVEAEDAAGVTADSRAHGTSIVNRGGAVLQWATFHVPYVLLPNHFLRWSATFNAAALNNALRGFYQAWRIPRGQISFIGP